MVGIEVDLAEQTVPASARPHTIVQSSSAQSHNRRRAPASGAKPRISGGIVIERINHGARDEIVASEGCDRTGMCRTRIRPPAPSVQRVEDGFPDFGIADLPASFRGEERFFPTADLTGSDVEASRAILQNVRADE